MKRTLTLSLILAALLSPLQAAEWNSSTTGDQTVSENVTVTGTANVGNIIFTGDSTVSGEGSIGGSGNIDVNSGTVVFDGVSRPYSKGNINIASGATLEIKGGAKLLSSEGEDAHNATSVVTVRGTLRVENLNYNGSLGCLHDNIGVEIDGIKFTDSFQLWDGARVEITESGSATIGALVKGYGQTVTIAVDAGKSFTWAASGNGNVIAEYGGDSGSKLVLEAGEGAVFTLGKNIGAGLGINKTGTGTLVLNSTLNLVSGRRIDISAGTVKFGDNARITSAGDGFFVGTDATMDLEGKGGISGQAVTVNGAVMNGQNNDMNLTLGSTGSFSISGDATAGFYGTIVLAEGAEVDLGGYVFYNSIDISAGGTLLNASKHRGTIMLGADEDGITTLDSNALAAYSSSLATNGSIAAEITEDFVAESPDFELQKGRLYAAGAVSITGNGEESVSITGYTTEFGAVSAQGNYDGDIFITDVLDVTLSDNHATSSTTETWMRAGALSAGGVVTIEAAGDVVISGNSSTVDSSSAGAIYAAGGNLTIDAASIAVENNTTGPGDGDDFSGGALRSAANILLSSTEDNIVITGNTADYSGGALYADGAVEISSAADIEISGNMATNGDGGAIYSMENVIITPGEGGSVSISDNEACLYGGAIYSQGDVSLSGGPMVISGNTTGSAGGAIYAEGDVSISADAGDIVFTGNTAGGEANDIQLWGGTASLSATNGNTLEMQGGVTCAAEINISTDEESTVKLGGTSSAESLTIEGGRVHGIYDEDGNQAIINVSTSVTLNNARLQDIALVDEYHEAALISTSSTYVFNDTVGMLEIMDDGSVSCTSSAPLLNNFHTVEGDLSIGMTLDFFTTALAKANGNAVNITLGLLDEMTGIGTEDVGRFTLSLSDEVVGWLSESTLEEYGFYDAEGALLGINEVELVEGGAVIFAISGLTMIPEPSTTTLSLLALSALCLRRRRQK